MMRVAVAVRGEGLSERFETEAAELCVAPALIP